MIRLNETYHLRPLLEGDAPHVLELQSNPKTMEFYGMDVMKNIQEATSEIVWMQGLEPKGDGFRWAIADLDNVYCGNIGVFNYQKEHNRIELGYILKSSLWGQGIMSRALKEVLAHCFETKHYNRVEAIVDPRNTGSAQVLLKNNFTFEGVLRDYEFEKGHYIDVAMYAILARDFCEKQ